MREQHGNMQRHDERGENGDGEFRASIHLNSDENRLRNGDEFSVRHCVRHGLRRNIRHRNGCNVNRNGGIRLKVAPEAISVGQVFRVFEANVPFAECFTGSDNRCPLTATCRLRGQLSNALEAFYSALDKVTLADLVTGNSGLQMLLQLEPA